MIAVAVAMGLAALGSQARAGIVVDISQVGANVVMNASGSIDPTVLTRVGDGGIQPLVFGAAGWVLLGPLSGGDVFTGLTGPLSFGTGDLMAASSASGDSFGLEASLNGFGPPTVYLPFGYTAGTELSGTATYDNTTIAALGLTPGTYTYTPTGLGATADNTFTISIGSVPEPSSLTMAATAAGLLGGLAFHRRRRKKG
jgi:MYXO-CTERM domain-containing protein